MVIHQLPPDVAAKIAAGEVVERPASLVKELVENAIDAGATRISIELENGGVSLIKVIDNGCGFAKEDLPLAFSRHATSKIQNLDDLSRLHTLGFRGEALASSGAVADVSIVSRAEQAESGARISMEHGVIGPVTAVAAPKGSIITVRNLFARIPARLKFLKTPQTEAGACLQVVERYALAYPEIQFTYSHDGRVSLKTSGDGDIFSAAASVYDVASAEQMVPLRFTLEDDEAAEQQSGPITVTGLTSRPAFYKSTRQHIYLFVNRRWAHSQSLTHAAEEAYHSLLLTGRHPVCFVFIQMPPEMVDVNVSPTKTEVKFVHERRVYAAVQRAIRAAVLNTTEAPAVSGAFGKTAPSPMSGPAPLLKPYAPPSEAAPLWSRDELKSAQISRAPEELRLTEQTKNFPALRVLGQISQSYIITEGPDGVYLIDQHAAHERIVLEQMLEQWNNKTFASQALLEPVVAELTPEQSAALEERKDIIERAGFIIEPFGVSTVLVRAIPAPLAKQAGSENITETLREMIGTDPDAHGETWEEHALANLACHAAIKAGQALTLEEQRALVRQLEETKAPHSCCHGRPTTVKLSLDALQREFARR